MRSLCELLPCAAAPCAETNLVDFHNQFNLITNPAENSAAEVAHLSLRNATRLCSDQTHSLIKQIIQAAALVERS